MNELYIWTITVLVTQAVMLPLFFCIGFWISKSSFQDEGSRNYSPLKKHKTWLLILVSEGALVKIWYVLVFSHIEDGNTEWHIEWLLYATNVMLTVVVTTDLLEHLIANKLLFINILIYFIITGLCFFIDQEMVWENIKSSALGIFFSGICFGAVYLFTKGGMGAGDVKLALVMGLLMTARYSIKALLFGCIVGSICAIVMLIGKKIKKEDAFPFGPFLYIGMIISMITG